MIEQRYFIQHNELKEILDEYRKVDPSVPHIEPREQRAEFVRREGNVDFYRVGANEIKVTSKQAIDEYGNVVDIDFYEEEYARDLGLMDLGEELRRLKKRREESN